MTLHSALYVAAAATISGLLRGAGSAFLPGSGAALSWLTSSSLSTVAVAAAGCAVAPAAAGREPPLSQRVARLVPLVVAAVGVGGLAVGLLARLLPVDAAVGGPWLAGVRRWADGALLVYPLLALGGIKLLAEDVPAGRPLPLVASLFLYGAALMLASRRVRGLRARGP